MGFWWTWTDIELEVANKVKEGGSNSPVGTEAGKKTSLAGDYTV